MALVVKEMVATTAIWEEWGSFTTGYIGHLRGSEAMEVVGKS